MTPLPAVPPPVLPPHGRGQRIGLLGGTFDPAHDGHRLASLAALRRFGLDRVWWLVTPGNPLKAGRATPPLGVRVASARAVARHPRIVVTGVERELGTRYAADTVRALRRRCPGVRFVWIMGADLLPELHRWHHWRAFLAAVPVGVVDRPGSTFEAGRGRAAALMARFRLPESEAGALALAEPPALAFIHGPRSTLSSTRLRAVRQG